jgi:hypothetical protein
MIIYNSTRRLMLASQRCDITFYIIFYICISFQCHGRTTKQINDNIINEFRRLKLPKMAFKHRARDRNLDFAFQMNPPN